MQKKLFFHAKRGCIRDINAGTQRGKNNRIKRGEYKATHGITPLSAHYNFLRFLFIQWKESHSQMNHRIHLIYKIALIVNKMIIPSWHLTFTDEH